MTTNIAMTGNFVNINIDKKLRLKTVPEFVDKNF